MNTQSRTLKPSAMYPFLTPQLHSGGEQKGATLSQETVVSTCSTTCIKIKEFGLHPYGFAMWSVREHDSVKFVTQHNECVN